MVGQSAISDSFSHSAGLSRTELLNSLRMICWMFERSTVGCNLCSGERGYMLGPFVLLNSLEARGCTENKESIIIVQAAVVQG